MATHSSVLAWRIPGTGEPGRLPSYGVAQSRTRLKQVASQLLLCAVWPKDKTNKQTKKFKLQVLSKIYIFL